MKKSFLTLLIIILFVGFLESFPKHYIVETKEGTTKATDKVGKHHGCVDSSGRMALARTLPSSTLWGEEEMK